MKRTGIIAATSAAAAAFTLGVTAGPAEAVRIEPPTRKVESVHLTHVDAVGPRRAFYYELNNGATFVTRNRAACDNERRPILCRRAALRAELKRAYAQPVVDNYVPHIVPGTPIPAP